MNRTIPKTYVEVGREYFDSLMSSAPYHRDAYCNCIIYLDDKGNELGAIEDPGGRCFVNPEHWQPISKE